LKPFVIAVVSQDPRENRQENKDAEGTTRSSQDKDSVTFSEHLEKNSEVTATVSVRLLSGHSGELPVKGHGMKEVIALPLVAVFLINMRTNNRIHDALKLQVGSHSHWDTRLVEKIAMYAPPRVCTIT
jgi:hypothetical protein